MYAKEVIRRGHETDCRKKSLIWTCQKSFYMLYFFNNQGDEKMTKPYLLTDAEWTRMYSLYEKAVSQYLNKTDFNVSDWLSDKEGDEYSNLVKKQYGE